MSQDWEIRLNRNVRKTLKKLGKAVNRRLKTALKKLEEDPKSLISTSVPVFHSRRLVGFAVP